MISPTAPVAETRVHEPSSNRISLALVLSPTAFVQYVTFPAKLLITQFTPSKSKLKISSFCDIPNLAPSKVL